MFTVIYDMGPLLWPMLGILTTVGKVHCGATFVEQLSVESIF